MGIAFWIVQGLLAAAFVMAGAMKLATPKAKLEENMGWVKHATAGQVKVVGLLELLGGIGVVLPGVLGIAPVLVPIAAAGLVLTMVGAIVTHRRIGDAAREAVPATVLLVLALVVAIGRGWITPL